MLQVLALCTAAVMYLVSRDRFTMDLEKGTLELMLRVLSVQDPDQTTQQDNKSVRRCCCCCCCVEIMQCFSL